ncbi:MAG: hypothetical protein U0414_08485 [Polyangiaceae bacterium]
MTAESPALLPLPPGRPPKWVSVGNPFLNAPLDYALIGGLFGIAVGVIAYASGFRFDTDRFWLVMLATSYAHFAASTVRLYSRKGAVSRWPFITLGVPVLTIAATSALLFVGDPLTWSIIQGFYLTWSTYHYAAQTFGLSVMYAYRSGCALAPRERRLVRAACLLPFVYGVLGARSGASLLVPQSFWTDATVTLVRDGARTALLPLLLLAPAIVFLYIRQSSGRVLPLISLVMMYGNAIFWTFFLDRDAFAWAALAHALQYLVIVTVFHVKDEMSDPKNTHGRTYHVVGFYGLCLILGWLLFDGWPRIYAWISLALDNSETERRIAWVINIHHFLVDGYIWKLRNDKKNLDVVVGASRPLEAGAAGGSSAG